MQIDATSLSRVFSAPMWLRDLGLLAWFLVGVGILLVGLVWLLGLTSTIIVPVTLGAVLATVGGPVVTMLQRHGIPRAAGAAVVLLGMLAITVVIANLIKRRGRAGALVAWPFPGASGGRTPQGSTVNSTSHQMMT